MGTEDPAQRTVRDTDPHHADTPALWMVSRKATTGRSRISYDDAVSEALAFGWVDSLPRCPAAVPLSTGGGILSTRGGVPSVFLLGTRAAREALTISGTGL
jgi:hypothetical protein